MKTRILRPALLILFSILSIGLASLTTVGQNLHIRSDCYGQTDCDPVPGQPRMFAQCSNATPTTGTCVAIVQIGGGASCDCTGTTTDEDGCPGS